MKNVGDHASDRTPGDLSRSSSDRREIDSQVDDRHASRAPDGHVAVGHRHVVQREAERPRRAPWTSVAIVVLVGSAAFLLLGEHRAHALGALPWLILLACPLIHLLMHRHHGGH